MEPRDARGCTEHERVCDTSLLTQPGASVVFSPKDWLLSPSWGWKSPSGKTWEQTPKTSGPKRDHVVVSFRHTFPIPGNIWQENLLPVLLSKLSGTRAILHLWWNTELQHSDLLKHFCVTSNTNQSCYGNRSPQHDLWRCRKKQYNSCFPMLLFPGFIAELPRAKPLGHQLLFRSQKKQRKEKVLVISMAQESLMQS